MDISVVVPLFNEEESLPELTAWIKRVMEEHNFSYEIMLIDDGSRDNSWEVVEKLQKENVFIKVSKISCLSRLKFLTSKSKFLRFSLGIPSINVALETSSNKVFLSNFEFKDCHALLNET